MNVYVGEYKLIEKTMYIYICDTHTDKKDTQKHADIYICVGSVNTEI